MSFTFENEDHTFACMLRDKLFEDENIHFASCTVPHQQKCVNVLIHDANGDSSENKEIIKAAIQSIQSDIDSMLKIVDAHLIQESLC